MNRLNAIYDYIIQYKCDNGGLSPTIREIGRATGINSTSMVNFYLDKLQERGRIIRGRYGKARHIAIPGEIYLPAGRVDSLSFVYVEEAAAVLDIHPESVRRLIRDGKLPAERIGNKLVLDPARLLEFQRAYDKRPGNKRENGQPSYSHTF